MNPVFKLPQKAITAVTIEKSFKKWQKLVTLLLFLFFVNQITAQVPITYNTPGTYTWTCPAGVTSIRVEAYGAGGGGGRGDGSNFHGGGGGGGGAYTVNNAVAVSPGQNYTIVIGAGGAGGTNSNGLNGGDGGNTSGTFITTVTANGGKGGQSYANGRAGGAGGTGGTRNGGTGANGTAAQSGGGGGGGGTTGNGSNGSGTSGGAGGGGMAGSGGTGTTANSGQGTGGGNYGAGGGGATKANNGPGSGAGGYLSINFSPPVNDICAGAIALTPNIACNPITGTTTGATDNDETGDCTNGTENAVWYKFTATTTSHIVTVDGAVGFDAVIGALVSCGSSTVPTGGACTDNTLDGGIESMTLTGLTIGATYYVQVYDYSGTQMANAFTICVQEVPVCSTPNAPTSLSLTQPSNGTINGTFTAAAPAPSNYLVVYNTTGTTPTPVNGTTYTVGGTVGAGNTVADTDSNTSFSVTGLNPSTQYYFFVFSYNNTTCSGGPAYQATPLAGNATTPMFYCTPAPTSVDGTGITNVTMGTINNTTGSEPTRYGDYSAMITNHAQLSTVNFSITFQTSTYDYSTKIWVDWNNDGDFNDAGEEVYSGLSGTTSPNTLSSSFVVPAGATIGNHRVRIGGADSSTPTPCYTGSYATYEDYTINVFASGPCSTPGTQPTALTLVPSGNTVSGSFTAAVPAPNSYLVVMNTTGAVPSPVNGTTYTIGGTVGAGNTVVDIDTDTTFTATGLTVLTQYYFFVFSYNNACTGGPLYQTTNPLNGNTTTLAGSYCSSTSTSSSNFINQFSTTGGSTNITNNSSGYSATGYGNFTGMTVSQAPYGTVNFSFTLTGGGSGVNIWIDWNNDFDFDDAGEKVYGSNSSVTTVSGSFTIPYNASLGNHRMRIRSNYNDSTPDSCGSITNGETEDYTLVVTSMPCAGSVSNVTVSPVGTTTATVTWAAATPAPANGYDYFVTTVGTIPGPGQAPTGTVAAGVTTINLTGLSNNTYYMVYIRTRCAAGAGQQGVWVGPTGFTTGVVAPSTTGATICQGAASTTISASGSCASNANLGMTINGAWNAATDPVALQPLIFISSGDPCAFDTETANYTVTTFQVSVTGTYTFSMSDTAAYDGMGYIVTGPFTPGSCATGTWIAGDDDGGPTSLESEITANLVSGVTYQLISTVFSFANTTITNTYTWNITGPGNLTNGLGGSIEWYTTATGGTPIASGNSFNPVGTPGSGLVNTNTPGTYTYYAACSANPGVRSATNFVINGPTAVISGSGSVCDGATNVTVTLTGQQPWTITYTDGINPPTVVAGINSSPYVFSVSPSITTTYTLLSVNDASGCSAIAANRTGSAVITGGKIWSGVTNTDWNTASNWSGGTIPTNTDCVIIPNTVNKPIISGTGYVGYAKNLTVHNNAKLTVNPNNSLSVVDWVTINAGGDLILEDDASLVQINNSANTGIAHIKKTSQPMYRLDYTYWNSPVTTASGFTVGNLTSGTNQIYRYTPTVANGSGTWSGLSTGTVMNPTFGVIARAPGSFPSTGPKQTFTVNFTGTPNNGIINMPIAMGTDANLGSTTPSGGSTLVTDADDEWNLIGNPYPSAIDIVSFLTDPANVPVVDGTIYLWTHNTAPNTTTQDPFYGNYVYNYTVNDYATVNFMGTTTTTAAVSGGPAPSQYIPSGQSFFISAESNGTVSFKNSMRVINNNSNFNRVANENRENNGFETQRLWLNLSNNNGGFSQILVGYAQGATLGWDRGFDGETLAGNAVKFYSLGANKKLTIQGRPWPFVQEDIVPLGLKATAQGNYTIGIDHFDTQFNDANIYLEDKLLNIIHNLKSAPYSFTSAVGTFDNRFVLRYTENTLSNNDPSVLENSVVIYTDDKLNVTSTLEPIKEVMVYDILGRVLVQNTKVNSNTFTAATLNPTQTTLIVKVTLENGAVINKKVIY